MFLSASDNVRADTTIEEDGRKAEVAAGREGQECYSKLLSRPLQHAACAGIKHRFSAVGATWVIRKEIINVIVFLGLLQCSSDPIHVSHCARCGFYTEAAAGSVELQSVVGT